MNREANNKTKQKQNFLQQIETIMEIHKSSKCQEKVTMRCPVIVDIFMIQSYLRLKRNYGRWVERL